MRQLKLAMDKASVRNALALLGIISNTVLIFTLMRYPIPAPNEGAVNIILGAWITGTGIQVYNYFFGSSKGETDSKNAQIEVNKNLAEKVKP